jgi:hypothetical protein
MIFVGEMEIPEWERSDLDVEDDRKQCKEHTVEDAGLEQWVEQGRGATRVGGGQGVETGGLYT